MVAAARPRAASAAAALLLLATACASNARKPDLAPLAPGEEGCAIRVAKILTCDDDDNVFAPGLLLVRNGKLAYVGRDREIPAGYAIVDARESWATPGMVELHSHIHSGGFADTNDMVLPVNPELRASAALVPANRALRNACAGGVTTLFGIPGSGTSMSGFGVVYKAKTKSTFEECIVRNPGGLKIAQSYNPERGAGDLGATRAGLAWILEDVNDRALGSAREDDGDLGLANLRKVHARELPVLIHSAGSDGYTAAARMWQTRYGTRTVLSHGCFDAWRAAEAIVASGAAINAGPRTVDFTVARNGAINGTAAKYLEAGAKDLSLNTDSPVVPQEELFLQGSMSARFGADAYLMLRACTIAPARVFGLDERVGSLEVGKDADIVLRSGEPLDPRARVDSVLIDGRIEYDRRRDGQWF